MLIVHNLPNLIHPGHGYSDSFAHAPVDWYDVSDRLDKLYQCMSDTPDSTINLMLHTIQLLELDNKTK